MITRESAVGMMVGLAVGDALGAPLEFTEARIKPDYITRFATGGVHDMSLGEWTDDTAMALAMARSLVETEGRFDARGVMRKFVEWYRDGKHIPRGVCFDIGGTTQKALSDWMSGSNTPYCGVDTPRSAGNGALMRMAPAIIASKTPSRAIELAVQQTLLTHAHPECVEYSRMFGEELWYGNALSKYQHKKLPVDFERSRVMSGGYVVETYQCAMWAFQTTDNFEDCVIEAINRGHDSDTVGAVAGMIAGAKYGHRRIPDHFKEKLLWHDTLVDTALALFDRRQ